MDQHYSKAINAYQFLFHAEKNQRPFTLEDLACATGYSHTTLRSYIVKRWWWFLRQSEQGIFTCQGLVGYPIETFMGQLWQRSLPEFMTAPHTMVRERNKSYERQIAIQMLEEMIEANAEEAAFQQHLERHFWMFGSEYKELCTRRRWTRDEQQDFVLRSTTDGSLKLIEIKTSLRGQPLFCKNSSHHTLYPRSEVACALGQVMYYLEKFDTHRNTILAEDGEDVAQITAKIIIGRDSDASQAVALRRLNSHLYRIEIMTFDQLLLIAKQILALSSQSL